MLFCTLKKEDDGLNPNEDRETQVLNLEKKLSSDFSPIFHVNKLICLLHNSQFTNEFPIPKQQSNLKQPQNCQLSFSIALYRGIEKQKFENIKFETHNQTESQASFGRGLLQLELQWEVDSVSCSGFDGKGKSRRASRGLPRWYSGSAGEMVWILFLWSGE